MTVNSKAFFLVASVAISVLCSAVQPFSRYQDIIDRKPFGPEPVNFDPEAAPGSAAANAAALGEGEMTAEQRTAEEQQMASNVRVSMINVTPAGAVAVGFTDSSVQPVENYYLVVGRSQNGWTVKSADPATESVTLEKGGIEVTVKLGETSGGGKGANVRGSGRAMALRAGGGKDTSAPQADGAPASEPSRLGGLARLRKRRAEMQAKAQAAAEKKAQAAAAEAAAREEREAKEAEEKQARAEQEAREAEERAQQREALRQIQEQLRRDREAKEAAQQESEEAQEE